MPTKNRKTKALDALARSRGILCVVDGSQDIGNIAIDVKRGRHRLAPCEPRRGRAHRTDQREAGRRFVTRGPVR